MKFIIYIMGAFLCLILSTHAFAVSDMGDNYERDHAKGYWFYDDPEPIESPPPESHDEPKSTPTPEPQQPKIETPPQKKTTVKLTVEWIKENLPKYRTKAIDDPSPDNMRAYFYLQRLMMDKSQRFADAAQKMLLTDPLLDENIRRPTAAFGSTQANTDSEAVMNKLLDRLSKRVGVWFFYRQDEMSMNNIQAGVLATLERTTGIKVMAISMDGSSLPNNHFPNAKQDQGHSDQLKIVQTPALFLVRPNTNEIGPIAQSAISYTDLKRRILVAATSADWISEDDFNATRGMKAGLTLDSTPSLNIETLDNPQSVADELERQLMKRINNEF